MAPRAAETTSQFLEPSLATAISLIASAIATTILRWAAYNWPSGRNKHDDTDHDHKHAGKHAAPTEDEEQ